VLVYTLAVADNPRIQELRRRVQQDPASLSFAPLAEELRRAGQLADAVATCRAGLKRHPEYVSARATLGRALLDQGDLDAALDELTTVLQSAPEHLAALKGIAEIHAERGDVDAALASYRRAFDLAREDQDLARAIAALEAQAPAPPSGPDLASGSANSPVLERLEAFLQQILAARVRLG
jgi:tetratricopeptide (TPR) repeat protein